MSELPRSDLEDKVLEAITGVGPNNALAQQVGGNHYKNLKIQPVEYIMENNIPYIEGCVIKYVTRWKNKNGIEDLRKAKHFLEILIQQQEKQNG